MVPTSPPQKTRRAPVHATEYLGGGLRLAFIDDHVSVAGLYRPPSPSFHTSMTLPVHAANQSAAGDADGALADDIALQVSLMGLYRRPLKLMGCVGSPMPSQIIIELPVQTAEWRDRAEGAPLSEVGVQLSSAGS